MEKYYFTFMQRQNLLKNRFVVITAPNYTEARQTISENFGTMWAFQYSEAQWREGGTSQAEKYNLTELNV